MRLRLCRLSGIRGSVTVSVVAAALLFAFTSSAGLTAMAVAPADDDGVNLWVSDTGQGIPREKIDHILDRFGQIESPYARSHGGIGLGLPIVKSLITLHGGTLCIESEVGKGTTVRVHLPAERRLASQSSAETAAA